MIDKKGFTLIELLAVITILGILMLVAIPAVSRTIENARKNTFITTAQTYVEAVRNGWAADEISCTDPSGGGGRKVASALPVGADYYVEFDTESGSSDASNNASALIGDGGKSSWGSAEVKGYVLVHVESVPASGAGGGGGAGATPTGADSIKLTYYVSMVDSGGHGILADKATSGTGGVPADQLTRADVSVTGATYAGPTSATPCVVTG